MSRWDEPDAKQNAKLSFPRAHENKLSKHHMAEASNTFTAY